MQAVIENIGEIQRAFSGGADPFVDAARLDGNISWAELQLIYASLDRLGIPASAIVQMQVQDMLDDPFIARSLGSVSEISEVEPSIVQHDEAEEFWKDFIVRRKKEAKMLENEIEPARPFEEF